MKKILFVLCLFIMVGSSLFVSEAAEITKAEVTDVIKPLVCLQGENYNSNLEYPGYQIVYNNVNYAVSGKYVVKYEDILTKEQYLKEVEIVEKTTLSSTGYCQISERNLFLKSNLTERYVTNIQVGDYNYLIHNLINPENQEDGVTVYFSSFYKDYLQWQKVLATNSKVLITKILSDGVNLYLIGYIQGESTDIYLAIYNFEGKLLTEETIYGNKYEGNVDALLWNEHLYLIGTTTSTDSYFKGTRSAEDSFIAKIDKNSLLLKDIYVFGNVGLDYISDFIVFNEKLYLSYSYLENNFRQNVIIIMDQQFNLLQEEILCLQQDYKTIKMVCDNNYLYILSSYYSSAHSKRVGRVYAFDVKLNVKLNENFIYEGYAIQPVDLVVNEYQTISILFGLTDANLKNGFSLVKYHLFRNVLEITQINNKKPEGFNDNKGTSIYLLAINKLNKMTINTIEVQKYGPTTLTESVNNYQVEINSEKVTCQKELSRLSYNPSKFGQYRLIYGFETNQIIFLYHLDSYLPEEINVRNNETYDLDYVLKFNGEGYLNGKRIYPNTKITQEGSYLLEVVGVDNYKKQINFKIADYQMEQLYYQTNLRLTEILGNQVNEEQKAINVMTNDIAPVKATLQNSWLIVFPMITILTCAIFIIRFR